MSKIKIAVVSDTHMGQFDDELLYLNDVVFKGADIVIHCGDLVELNVLDAFYDKEIYGVSGNMDSLNVRNSLPYIQNFNLHGISFCVLHGVGYGSGLYMDLINEFPDTDVFLHGHTHKPEIKKLDKYLFFNPGSFSHNRIEYPKRSAGIIGIDRENGLSFSLVELDELKNNKFKITEVFNDKRFKRDGI